MQANKRADSGYYRVYNYKFEFINKSVTCDDRLEIINSTF